MIYESIWERLFFYIVVAIFILLLAGGCLGIALAVRQELPSQVMMRECIEDGQKHYVCYAMIYGGRSK